MGSLLVHLLLRTLVFGVAITFACKRFDDVKVQPKEYLPVVALVFAVLNTALYHVLGFALNMVTLWTLWFAVPFVANGLLLLATDKVLKNFKIETLTALIKTAGVVTVAHLILRLIPHA
jgi:uncharacterized membrane protein YvlD (DUF360 family)